MHVSHCQGIFSVCSILSVQLAHTQHGDYALILDRTVQVHPWMTPGGYIRARLTFHDLLPLKVDLCPSEGAVSYSGPAMPLLDIQTIVEMRHAAATFVIASSWTIA